MINAVKNIVEGFPCPAIPLINSLPTYKTIYERHLLLSTNASSIQTNFGGGAHGLLALTFIPAVFNTAPQITVFALTMNL